MAFTLAHSQYYPTTLKERKLQLVAIALNKDGSVYARIDPENPRTSNNKSIRYKTNIRDTTKKVTDDEAIVVDFDKLPADVWAVLFFLKLPNLTALDALKETDSLRFSRIGLEDYTNAIDIDHVNVFSKISIESLLST